MLSYKILESIYNKYNKFNYIHPDPLEFVYNYDSDADREIAGLLASSLAYGNVKQILKSVSKLLDKMGKSPVDYLMSKPSEEFYIDFACFKHRFTTGNDIAKLLSGLQLTLQEYSSLKNYFAETLESNKYNYLQTIADFTQTINCFYNEHKSYLIPSPINRSACKRLMLYLRWMIRKDNVDPGCWNNLISPEFLIIPLDTHMYNISSRFSFTARKSADLKTAIEITNSFKKFNKSDPVKYDFALTRFGIRDELTYDNILNR